MHKRILLQQLEETYVSFLNLTNNILANPEEGDPAPYPPVAMLADVISFAASAVGHIHETSTADSDKLPNKTVAKQYAKAFESALKEYLPHLQEEYKREKEVSDDTAN